MVREVGDGFEVQPLGGFACDADGVGVVEADRVAHADAAGFERVAEFVERAQVLINEQFAHEGACIFRIRVDVAPEQTAEEHA